MPNIKRSSSTVQDRAPVKTARRRSSSADRQDRSKLDDKGALRELHKALSAIVRDQRKRNLQQSGYHVCPCPPCNKAQAAACFPGMSPLDLQLYNITCSALLEEMDMLTKGGEKMEAAAVLVSQLEPDNAKRKALFFSRLNHCCQDAMMELNELSENDCFYDLVKNLSEHTRMSALSSSSSSSSSSSEDDRKSTHSLLNRLRTKKKRRPSTGSRSYKKTSTQEPKSSSSKFAEIVYPK